MDFLKLWQQRSKMAWAAVDDPNITVEELAQIQETVKSWLSLNDRTGWTHKIWSYRDDVCEALYQIHAKRRRMLMDEKIVTSS